MTILDRENLKRELQTLPRGISGCIALRAAMRVLPVLSIRGGSNSWNDAFWYWAPSDRSRYVLSLFRLYSTAYADLPVLSYFVVKRAEKAADDADHVAERISEFEDDASVVGSDCASAVARVADAAAKATTDVAISVKCARAAAEGVNVAAAADAAVTCDLLFAKSTISFPSGSLDELVRLLERPLWPDRIPYEIGNLWVQFQADSLSLEAGFELWLEWYQQRLDGVLDLRLGSICAELSEERWAQTPAEVNAHLYSVLKGAAKKHFRRVRAIFIGNGGVGKTSLIRALHGEAVVEGWEPLTPGVAIADAIQDDAGVFTKITSQPDSEMIVHFWDFGGQVMAHGTHQFFLRSHCLYVIVLDSRAERNSNEEAEYWLEHVRAFGGDAPVLLVGNKADQVSVNLDFRSLNMKYANVVNYYPLSCTGAKGLFKAEFERFQRDFSNALESLGREAERFTDAQFSVLQEIQQEAARQDFLIHDVFDNICAKNRVAPDGPSGRGALLDLFDKLGIVMYFPTIPFLNDLLLNPRWLTYGVYSVMHSEKAKNSNGRIGEADVVEILRNSSVGTDQRKLTYPPDRCRNIVDAMVAFRIAYRLAHSPDRLVIPALLEPNQPEHDFKPQGALAFEFDFKGFIPRHVLPALVVDNHENIVQIRGRQVVWQNGVLLRHGRGLDAEALVKADYHERHIDIRVKGSDALTYLGLIRDGILRTLQTMPELPFEEKVQLRPDMRTGGEESAGRFGDAPKWMSYNIIQTAQKNRVKWLPGPDGFMYDIEKVLAVMPVPPEFRPADVFLSYSSQDRKTVEELAQQIEQWGRTVWFDRELIGGQQFRDVIDQRIDAAKAVVVLWTESSIGSKYVRYEADRASRANKLICICDPDLDLMVVPGPFAANDHFLKWGDFGGLKAALARLRGDSR